MRKDKASSEIGLLLLVLVVASLAYTILVYPIQSLLTRESQRFKLLKTLRVDSLIEEILKHGDFGLDPKEPRARERELQRVAGHISEYLALGGVDDHHGKAIVETNFFFVLLNGLVEHERHRGIAIGFYVGVLGSVAAVAIMGAAN